MSARWKRLSGTLAVLGVLAGAGAVSGAALRPEPVAAGCEDDECEGGNKCTINSTTGCDVQETGGCKTVACDDAVM